MMHRRRWCVSEVKDAEELARLLTERTWTLCSGFELAGYLFLNDSTSEDGAQEYAVVKRPRDAGALFIQVESITFGWCSAEEALGYIRSVLAGEADRASFAKEVQLQHDSPKTHGHCHLCA